MCSKQKHTTELEAQGHILSIMKAPYYSGDKLHYYFCTVCKAYHVTRMSQDNVSSIVIKKKKKKRKGIW